MQSKTLVGALLMATLAWGGAACSKGETPAGGAPGEAAPPTKEAAGGAASAGSPVGGEQGGGAATQAAGEQGGGAATQAAGAPEQGEAQGGAPGEAGQGERLGADEKGTTDCEAGRTYDALNIAVQEARRLRIDATMADAKATEAQLRADALLLGRMEHQASLCSGQTLDASCVGAASGDPARCVADRVQDSGDDCVQLATFRRAIIGGDASACAAIGFAPMKALCVGGLTGTYDCEDDAAKEWELCRLLKSGRDPICTGRDRSEDTCIGYWMMRALIKQDVVPCGHIGDRWARDQCRALATGDVSFCSLQGSIPERCREVVVDADVEEMTASGKPRYGVRLRAKNLYLEAALCNVVLELDVAGRATRLERSLGTLEPRSALKTFEWNLGDMDAMPLLTATAECKWVPTAVPTPAPAEQH